MGHPRFLVGYDVRPVRNPLADSRLLWQPNRDATLYSADDALWPSVWEREWRERQRSAFVGTTQHLWMNLEQLVEETRRHRLLEPIKWIALEAIVDSADRLLDSWQARAEPVRPRQSEEQWSILGVDIADYYVRSWMHAAFYDETWRQRVQASVGFLNEFGLFRPDCLPEALAIAAGANQAAGDDAGWAAFVLWSLPMYLDEQDVTGHTR